MSNNHEQAVDALTATIANKATAVGAGASFLGWLTSSEFGVLAGIAIGVAGLGVNWYYKHKQNKREQEAHDLLKRQKGEQ